MKKTPSGKATVTILIDQDNLDWFPNEVTTRSAAITRA